MLERAHDAPQHWRGNLPVTNRYTFGLAGERFFREIKENGRIMGSICHRCDVKYVPAAAFCERCLNPIDDWVEVDGSGEVHTFTLLCVNLDGSPKEVPEIVAFVRIGDGGLVHRLGGKVTDVSVSGVDASGTLRPGGARKGRQSEGEG